jgi:hypothetical protein
MRKYNTLGAGILVFLMLVSFQNCSGKPFESSRVTQSSSAQCKAEFIAKVIADKLPADRLNCGDLNSFACERRVFSPDVQDMQHSLRECLPGDQTCVDVDVFQFNTAGRAGSSSEQMAPGGDYNREEIRCYNKLQVRGNVVIQSDGDSVADALAKAMAACEGAQEGT